MLCLHAVTDEDGHPVENEDESGRRPCEHWGKIFEARVEGEWHRCHETILGYVQKAPDDNTVGNWQKMNSMNSWPLRRNPLQAPMGFHTAFTGVQEGWDPRFLFKFYQHILAGGLVPYSLLPVGPSITEALNGTP